MLTRYGTDNIIIMLVGGILFIIAGYFVSKTYISIPLYSLGVILFIFTLWFFRDPSREIPQEAITDESILISPADGKVVQIIDVEESLYLKSKARQISIFLSPLDVHVNRSPATGLVEFYTYNPGDYLVAYHPKSSELNEQSKIGLNTKYGKILFKQIVGILARRLVCELKVGDSIKAGEKFGMMKFGSRMDVIIPTDTEILVKTGDKVIGGETIIAKMNKNR